MNLVGRRNFLSGLGLGAGAALLTPFARHLIQRAQGQESTARRFVLMNTMNGLGHGDADQTYRWVPSSTELRADTLPPSLAPLAPWADDMLVVDFLYNPFNPGQHDNGWASLAVQGEDPQGSVPVQQSWETWPNPVGVSLDVFAGEKLSGGLPHSRIGWGADVSPYSADERGNKVTTFLNTQTAFMQVFGGFDPSASQEELRLRAERGMSVLDTVRGDLQRMRDRLAPTEQAQLEQFHTAIRALEVRAMNQAGGMTCSAPEAPPGITAGPHNGVYSRAYVETMMELHIVALECHLTNVILFNPVPSRRNYGEILGVPRHAHSMSHPPDYEADNLQRLDAYNAGLLVRVIERLEAVPENGGSMADQTLFCWYDQNGGSHHSPGRRHDDHPLITVGSLNGHFRTGRHVRFEKGQHAVSDGFVSMLQGLGVDLDRFGDPGVCRGPLPNLT
ncbi:MAG: DUF1552 domain-containing protein [Myxococcota bacterium]